MSSSLRRKLRDKHAVGDLVTIDSGIISSKRSVDSQNVNCRNGGDVRLILCSSGNVDVMCIACSLLLQRNRICGACEHIADSLVGRLFIVDSTRIIALLQNYHFRHLDRLNFGHLLVGCIVDVLSCGVTCHVEICAHIKGGGRTLTVIAQ